MLTVSTTLPVLSRADRRLADVLRSSFSAVKGEHNSLSLASAKRVVLVMIDGLGALNLRHRIAHARNLSRLPRDEVNAGFPTTTASALTSFTTGRDPGEHGLVGYRILEPSTGQILNQLSGLEQLTEPKWQRAQTIFESNPDIPSVVVSASRFRETMLTKLILRGAEYLVANTSEQRLNAVQNFLQKYRSGVAYVYIPELDSIAHASGVSSGEWAEGLEQLDGFIADLLKLLGANDGLIVSADHGVIDIPVERQRVIPLDSELLSGVKIGGEPRCLQLYANDDVAGLLSKWKSSESEFAHVVSKQEAIQLGWFGETSPIVASRIGDVLVSPRKEIAYYDDGPESALSRNMIGQHGGFSRAEMLIPIIKGGVFAKV